MGGTSAKKRKRVRRVIQLRLSGFTIPEISKLMITEGYAASERTVWGDLQDLSITDHLPELLRKYYEAVALLGDDPALQLKYLSPLILKLLPSKVEQKVQADVRTLNVEDFLLRYGAAKDQAKLLDENR